MDFIGYENKTYKQFQKVLWQLSVDSGKGEAKLSLEMGGVSIQSVRNCFDNSTQRVSDAILTKLMDCLGMEGFVLWVGGVRKYYIRNSK
jgi:hypothetical protein